MSRSNHFPDPKFIWTNKYVKTKLRQLQQLRQLRQMRIFELVSLFQSAFETIRIFYAAFSCFPLKVLLCHCCFRQPGEGIQIGPNWDLSKALNNRYRLPAPPASPAPGHFGVLLIKMHLLAFVVVAIKWIIRPKTKKNLFS